MTTLRGAVAVAVRVAAITVFYAAYLAVLSRSESTDALGAGLLFFLIVVVIALVWATIDAVRHGFVPAVAVWAVSALLSGFTLGIGHLLTDEAVSLSEVTTGDLPFFAVLLFVPALLGCALGGLVHRAARPTVVT